MCGVLFITVDVGKGGNRIMISYESMDNENLLVYKPKVYQRDIYGIDYKKLWDAGIRLISFDIDDTIAGYEEKKPEKEAKVLIQKLRHDGFEIILLSNNYDKDRVKTFAEELGIPEDKYISKAKKPLSKNFQKMMDDNNLQKEQMAHVGNMLTDDIAGGNIVGITTCYVRRKGKIGKVWNEIQGRRKKEQALADELKNRGIWRKHHKYEENDQFYQLGEEPLYKKREEGSQNDQDKE
jgi:hypothetical protein